MEKPAEAQEDGFLDPHSGLVPVREGEENPGRDAASECELTATYVAIAMITHVEGFKELIASEDAKLRREEGGRGEHEAARARKRST